MSPKYDFTWNHVNSLGQEFGRPVWDREQALQHLLESFSSFENDMID